MNHIDNCWYPKKYYFSRQQFINFFEIIFPTPKIVSAIHNDDVCTIINYCYCNEYFKLPLLADVFGYLNVISP